MPAGVGDAAPGRDDPRAFDHSALDRAAQLDDHRSVRAEIAHRRHAGAHRGARIRERLQRRRGLGLMRLRIEVGGAIEDQVRVAVDHARDRERGGCLDRARAGSLRRLWCLRAFAHPGDLAILHDDRGVGERGDSVEEAVDLEDRAHRRAVSSTRCHRRSSTDYARAARCCRTTPARVC